MKKISIIVPVYNTKEEYLRICLNSLVNQTINNEIEIIIVDDGSTNNSSDICDEYAKEYSNIFVIHQNNQGLGMSRNNGIKVAKGKWIMFVDSDDWVENNICEKLLELDKDDVDIIMTSCNECYKDRIVPINMFDGKDMIWNNNKEKLQVQLISKIPLGNECYNAKYLVNAWAKLYRRSFIENNKLDEVCKLRYREDIVFNLYCFEHANKIVYKNYLLYNYRQCSLSLVHNNDVKMNKYYLQCIEAQEYFIKKYNKKQIFYEAYQMRIITATVTMINKLILKNRNKYSIQKKQIDEMMNIKEIYEAFKCVNVKLLDLKLKIIVKLLNNKQYFIIKLMVAINNFIKKNEVKNMYE